MGHFETAEDAAAALDLDWAQILASLADAKCAPTATARDAFREGLRGNYEKLNRLFVHYAGVGRAGEAVGVSLAELAHFSHVARLAQFQNNASPQNEQTERQRIVTAFLVASERRRERVRKAKAEAKSESKSESKRNESKHDEADELPIKGLLSRAEFVAALVMLSLQATPGISLLDELKDRELTGNDGHGQETATPTPRHSSAAARRHVTSTRDEVRGAESVMDALEILLRRYVSPFLSLRRTEPDDDGIKGDEGVFLSTFDSRRVQDVVQQSRVHLKRVFSHYAKFDAPVDEFNEDTIAARRARDPPGRRPDRGIVLAGFKQCLQDAGLMVLLFTEENALEKLDKISLSSFLAVQHDPPFNLELDELVFVEFVEAYCRVANDMLNTSTLASKMLVAIDQLCEHSLNL